MSALLADAAARLAGLIPRLTGWPPDIFWSATPSELAAILTPEATGEPPPLTRGELERMMERESDG